MIGNFKVGDIVVVSNPQPSYEMYRGMIGTVSEVGIDSMDYNYVMFDENVDKGDAFEDEELELYKNHIVHNLLKDL